MRRSRHRRGSALIFAVILIAAITIYYVAAQELMMAGVRSQQRFENRTKARMCLESAGAYMISESRIGLLTLPATRTVTVAGIDVTAVATDNSGLVPRTMTVATTLTLKERTFADSMVVGQRIPASQWNYALFVNSTQTWSDVVTTGSLGVNGDAFFRNNATGGAYTHPINGDLECAGTVSAQFSVTGTVWPQAPSISFLVPFYPTYATAADTNYGSNLMNGYTFTDFGPTATHLVYRVGDLDLKGAFVGNGVVFATGDIDITGNITVTGGNLVIMSDGNVRLKSNNATVDAFVFSENDTSVLNAGMTVTGFLVTSTFSVSKDVTVIYDPYFWNNPTERARFKLPGFWP